MRDEPPTEHWARTVCLLGHGKATCRYLTMHPDGYSCEKHSDLRKTLDARVLFGQMVASGDNCEGRGARS